MNPFSIPSTIASLVATGSKNIWNRMRGSRTTKKNKRASASDTKSISGVFTTSTFNSCSTIAVDQLEKGHHQNVEAKVLQQNKTLEAEIRKVDKRIEQLEKTLAKTLESKDGDNPGPMSFEGLHMSGKSGLITDLEELLKKGWNVEMKNDKGNTPLHVASAAGHLGVVKLLLEAGADADSVGKYKRTPLHLAAQNGHTNVVRLLLDSGADMDAFESSNAKAIHLAAGYGFVPIMKIFIQRGANIEAPGFDRRTPLLSAARYKHPNMISTLLDSGADLEAVEPESGNRAIHIVAGNGSVSTTKALLARGPNLDVKNYDGDTPIDLAKKKGNTNVVVLLVMAQSRQQKA